MSEYLQQCIKVAKNVDIEKLASIPIGPTVGLGNDFEVTRHCIASLPGLEETFTALKLPRNGREAIDTWLRVTKDVAMTGFMLARSQLQASRFSAFVCMLEVEDSRATCILTEDMTCGGARTLKPCAASLETREQIYQAFSDFGTREEVLANEELDYSVVFDVSGEEMILDVTPGPISGSVNLYSRAKPYRDYVLGVRDAQSDITIPIPRDSVLGTALDERHRTIIGL